MIMDERTNLEAAQRSRRLQLLVAEAGEVRFSEDQPRDEAGKFGSGGGASESPRLQVLREKLAGAKAAREKVQAEHATASEKLEQLKQKLADVQAKRDEHARVVSGLKQKISAAESEIKQIKQNLGLPHDAKINY